MKTSEFYTNRQTEITAIMIVTIILMVISVSVNAQNLVVESDPTLTTIENAGNGNATLLNWPPGKDGNNFTNFFSADGLGADYFAYSGFNISDRVPGGGHIPFSRSQNHTNVRIDAGPNRIITKWQNATRTWSWDAVAHADGNNFLDFTVTFLVTPGGGYVAGDVIQVFCDYSIYSQVLTDQEDGNEDPASTENEFYLNGTDLIGDYLNTSCPNDPPRVRSAISSTIINVIVGQYFSFRAVSTVQIDMNPPPQPNSGQDKAYAEFWGAIEFSLEPATIPESRTEFSLDIGSDTERSDPFTNGNEVFDPGDAYILGGTPLDPGGQNGIKDDQVIFGTDPKPDPVDATTAAPCGSGLPLNPGDYFDLDGMDNIQTSLTNCVYGPGLPSIEAGNDQLLHRAEYFLVSYDDDSIPNYSIPGTVPVNSTSPNLSQTFGKSGNANEVVAVDMNAYLVPSYHLSTGQLFDEANVHVNMESNPDSTEENDDDVDALDHYWDKNLTGFYYFSPDHEATGSHPSTGPLKAGCIYELDPVSQDVVLVIDNDIHLDINGGTDIDAFEFGLVWDANADRLGLALLFSVDSDDPLTAEDESGGLDPAMIYYSFLNGSYAEFSSMPMDDDVDAITICNRSYNGNAYGAPPSAFLSPDSGYFCQGDSIIFTGVAVGNAVNWNWTFDGGNPSTYSGQTPPAVYYYNYGAFNVSLTVSNLHGSTTATGTINVLPANWRFASQSEYHKIDIPESVVPILNGASISPGTPVGAFYTDFNGYEHCGGHIIWDEGADFTLVAYGDDLINHVKDGFVNGEIIQWKVYDWATSMVYNMDADYDLSYPEHDGTWKPNGYSALTGLSHNSVSVHNINLNQGWSGISSNISPAVTDLDILFAPISAELEILLGTNGVYWPSIPVNTLGDWNPLEGYAIKVNQDAMLQLSGIATTNQQLAVSAGWTLIPVISKNTVDVVSLFSGLPGFVMAKQLAGNKVYWPALGINNMIKLIPGNAYWIYSTMDGVIDFGVKSACSNKSVEPDNSTSPWNEISTSPNTHVIAVDFSSGILSDGEVLGAFNENELCCGFVKCTGQTDALTVFGDDLTTTETDGMTENESMTFKAFNPLTDETRPIRVDFDSSLPDWDDTFEANGISRIALKTSVDENPVNRKFSVYPNPAKDFVNIEVSEGERGWMNIEIFDMTGRVVYTDQGVNANRITIHTGHLPNGVYQITIQHETVTTTKKLVIR